MSLAGVVDSRTILRGSGIALVLLALLVLPGCWVTSINGLYEQESPVNLHKDPDLVFDPSLIGSWSLTDDTCTTLLTIAAKDEVYDLQSAEQGEGCSAEKSHRQARLVKLGNYYFLDVSPMEDDVCDMCVAKHSVLLTRFDKATLSLSPVDSDWLKRSLTAKTVSLATLAGDTDTITASSKDLKAFCRKFAENTEVFKPESTSTFKRK